MPRRVDHDRRRAEITDAVVRLAGRRGLAGVTFREVAAEAGISVALVQRYFATKRNLVLRTVEAVTAEMTERFATGLAALGPDAAVLDRLRVLASSFLPTDEDGRRALVFYHGVGAAGLTDADFRGASVHTDADRLPELVAGFLRAGRAAGEVSDSVDAVVEARLFLALVVGSSLSVLLDNQEVAQAVEAVDAYLSRLRPSS